MADTEAAAYDGGVVNGGATESHVENGALLKQQPVVPITYGLVTAYLLIQAPKAAEALVFYKKAFGAEEVDKIYSPKRKAEQEEPLIRHAHVRIGETNIFLADEPEEASTVKSPATLNGTSFILHLPTSDVDAAVARAVEAGATVTMEVADQFWGERYGMVLDPYGYSWGLSTPLAKEAEIPVEATVEAGHAE
ncbi:unnamed protein product [Calypogeia fissa]